VPGAQDIVRKFPLIPFRHDSPLNGAFRWIRLGPVSIQPSEFAKPLLIFYLAAHFRLPLRTETLRRGVLAPVAMAGGILALVFLGRDLSTTVITGAIVAAIFFIAGVRLRYLFAMGCLGLVFVGLVVAVSDVRRQRIVDYLAHQENEKSGSDQVVQARMAMGSGGKTGLGFTLSRFTPTSSWPSSARRQASWE
jgi:cell division protein FtsW